MRHDWTLHERIDDEEWREITDGVKRLVDLHGWGDGPEESVRLTITGEGVDVRYHDIPGDHEESFGFTRVPRHAPGDDEVTLGASWTDGALDELACAILLWLDERPGVDVESDVASGRPLYERFLEERGSDDG